MRVGKKGVVPHVLYVLGLGGETVAGFQTQGVVEGFRDLGDAGGSSCCSSCCCHPRDDHWLDQDEQMEQVGLQHVAGQRLETTHGMADSNVQRGWRPAFVAAELVGGYLGHVARAVGPVEASAQLAAVAYSGVAVVGLVDQHELVQRVVTVRVGGYDP